ncbi:MAG: sel1 repeat family protein [Verrucomicrobia bacterium]|nr:sel1 repeat family protein [Verrucomicrobiota bacterium]
MECFRKAIPYNHSHAQFRLGTCYDFGKGVEQSHERAVEWYRLAAGQGDPIAQHNLANYCFDGKGITKDVNLAFKLYKQAADPNLVEAQCRVGYCCQHGIGTE